MSIPQYQMPAADTSDIIAVQSDISPYGGSQNVEVVGYPIDIAGYVSGLKVTNTQVGEFTGSH